MARALFGKKWPPRSCCPMGHPYETHGRINARGAMECVTCRHERMKKANQARAVDRRLKRWWEGEGRSLYGK